MNAKKNTQPNGIHLQYVFFFFYTQFSVFSVGLLTLRCQMQQKFGFNNCSKFWHMIIVLPNEIFCVFSKFLHLQDNLIYLYEGFFFTKNLNFISLQSVKHSNFFSLFIFSFLALIHIKNICIHIFYSDLICNYKQNIKTFLDLL